MTVSTAQIGKPDAQELPHATGFRVKLVFDWMQAAAGWNDRNASTPFQNSRWLDAWYGAFDADYVKPLIAIISDAATGEHVMTLPLILHLQRRIRIVEFADLDVTDYNAPVLGAAAPRDAKAAQTMWRDLLAALRQMPGGADLIRLHKMPTTLDDVPNPLALLGGASPCSLNGNILTTGDDFDVWRHSSNRTVRKELGRSWRVFTRNPSATFKIVRDKEEALRLLLAMELQQGARMRQLGLKFLLNDELFASFYRKLISNGVGEGYVVLSALTVGEEVVATLLGMRQGSRYVMVRISNAGEKWSTCSPGRLIIGRTMAALHRDGIRQFDFSIGNYAYKRRFGAVRTPLVNISAVLSWRGLPYVLRDRVVSWLRKCPRVAAQMRRAFGKPQSREEV